MTRIIVAGGGAIGCAIARELAARGAAVTVVERGIPGRGATWAAAGMLSPLGEPGPFRDLAAASLDRYPAFIESLAGTGIALDYGATGKLHVALTPGALAGLDALAAQGAAFGAERVDAKAALDLEPSVNPALLGGLVVRRDHRVDGRRLGEALWAAAHEAGARFVTGSVREVRSGSGARASGVRLEDGTMLEGAAVVIAAGAWSSAIHGLPFPLPVRPVRGQMLALAAAGPDGPRIGRMIETTSCYLVPRSDGRILVGATVEEAGFAPGPTLAGVAALADAAVEAVPGCADLPLLETWAGFRPGTPDGLPILGEDPDLPGLFYATGHFRNGILLAPITATTVADLVQGTTPPVTVHAFGVQRFRADEREATRTDDRPRRTGNANVGAPADAASKRDGAAEDAPRCDLCGAPMLDRHCKLVCTACGYMRDCSDP